MKESAHTFHAAMLEQVLFQEILLSYKVTRLHGGSVICEFAKILDFNKFLVRLHGEYNILV